MFSLGLIKVIKHLLEFFAASHICVGGHNIWYSGIVFGHCFFKIESG